MKRESTPLSPPVSVISRVCFEVTQEEAAGLAKMLRNIPLEVPLKSSLWMAFEHAAHGQRLPLEDGMNGNK